MKLPVMLHASTHQHYIRLYDRHIGSSVSAVVNKRVIPFVHVLSQTLTYIHTVGVVNESSISTQKRLRLSSLNNHVLINQIHVAKTRLYL